MSCKLDDDHFNSKCLTSSNGEHIYINTYVYGITGDHQRTIISKNKDRLREKSDTVGSIMGIDPFIYSFQNDTLTLIFNNIITYSIADTFESIYVIYKKIPNPQYMEYMQKAINSKDYHRVLDFEMIMDPSMPKPPSEE